MGGFIARQPWPNDHMDDLIHVEPAGAILTLAAADAKIKTRDYGDVPNWRASAAGDVLSWVFDHWEGRPPPASAAGPYETFALNGGFAVYCPDGTAANVRGFLAWLAAPNA